MNIDWIQELYLFRQIDVHDIFYAADKNALIITNRDEKLRHSPE